MGPSTKKYGPYIKGLYLAMERNMIPTCRAPISQIKKGIKYLKYFWLKKSLPTPQLYIYMNNCVDKNYDNITGPTVTTILRIFFKNLLRIFIRIFIRIFFKIKISFIIILKPAVLHIEGFRYNAAP